MRNSLLKNIVFGCLSLVALYFFWITYQDLKKSNEQYQLVKGIDEKVIDQLVKMRDLQVHYLAVKGEYASEWDSLFNFLRYDSIYMVQQKEHIIHRQYGGDSIYIEEDTIGVVAAYDSLRNKLGGLSLANIEALKYAPGHPQDSLVEFFINAGTLKKSPVFEIYDPKPLNPQRQKPKNRGGIPPLKVGSMTSQSIRGNWEY